MRKYQLICGGSVVLPRLEHHFEAPSDDFAVDYCERIIKFIASSSIYRYDLFEVDENTTVPHVARHVQDWSSRIEVSIARITGR